ncbi:MAG: AMP-binding protein [Chloroflexota bacterium]
MIKVIPVSFDDKSLIDAFISFPFTLYDQTPQWTPLLNLDAKSYFDRQGFPFYEHSEAAFFLARKNGRFVGRIAVLHHVPFNEHHNKNQAQFYFFDCINDEAAAHALLDSAADWAVDKGLDSLVGPKGFGLVDGYGLLIDGFDHGQTMAFTEYNLPYYASFMKSANFKKEIDFISYQIDGETFQLPNWIHGYAERINEQGEYRIRQPRSIVELFKAGREIVTVYNEGFSKNWEYYPLSEAEIKQVIENLIPAAVPKLLKMLYHKEQLVGLLFAVPDLSDVLKKSNGRINLPTILRLLSAKRKVEKVVLVGMSVQDHLHHAGLNALMISEIEKTLRNSSVRHVELINVAETAVHMRDDLETLGLRPFKTHRVYKKRLPIDESHKYPPADLQRHLKFTPATAFQSLVHLSETRALELFNQQVFSYLEDGETVTATRTFSELAHRARAIGQQLKEMDVQNQPILLPFPPGLAFIEALMGCLYAGAIGVPVHFPGNKRLVPRFLSVLKNSQAGLALTQSSFSARIQTILDANVEGQTLDLLEIDKIPNSVGEAWQLEGIGQEKTAVLQYTSGSTGNPKGVKISHGNFLANVQSICESADLFSLWGRGKGVIWLPTTHDMGLVGGVLMPIYGGGETIFMSPTAFMEKPDRWLRLMAKHEAHITAAPNFALDYCVEQISEEVVANLDLSSLHVLFCGAEKVRVETLNQFADKFQGANLASNSLVSCYGMAETTLLVSGSSRHEDFKTAVYNNQSYVSNGPIHESFDVQIVDSETLTAVAEGEVGEIWIAGPAVSDGYWRENAESQTQFKNHLAAQIDQDYYRTGDLGFIKDDELYVTGRLKDLIIVNGVNYYPADIEQSVELAHEALQPQGTAAFSIDNEQSEWLIIASELKRTHRKADLNEVAQAVQTAVSLQFQLPIQDIVFLRPGQLPRTSSGKVMRLECQNRYLKNELKSIGSISLGSSKVLSNFSGTPEFDAFKQDVAELLNLPIEHLDEKRQLNSYGLGSLKAAAFSYLLHQRYGLEITPQRLLNGMNLQDVFQNKGIVGKE